MALVSFGNFSRLFQHIWRMISSTFGNNGLLSIQSMSGWQVKPIMFTKQICVQQLKCLVWFSLYFCCCCNQLPLKSQSVSGSQRSSLPAARQTIFSFYFVVFPHRQLNFIYKCVLMKRRASLEIKNYEYSFSLNRIKSQVLLITPLPCVASTYWAACRGI